ncbi:thioesterase II family protein [Streptomyces sp. NPDC049879]|uniref:thioesterase II family protein n=1 Tax=Streptomyces sp. NPDC049879 TaxID=3365598 RepID=UPI00378AE618
MSGAVTDVATGAGVKDLRRLLAPASGGGQGAGGAAPFTLVLVHHAGGSAAAFAPFARRFPADWRVLAADLPGRLMAPDEPLCRSSREAVAFLAPRLRPLLTGPWAVFGHSMGALLAFETARALAREGTPPVWAGLSAAPAPGHRQDGDQRHLWPRERLTAFLRDLGGTPEDAFAMPDVLDGMLRVLRGDLAVVDTYRRHPGPPLDVPLTVFTGRDDAVATAATAAPWREQTMAATTYRSWPGGHFYLFDHVAAVCDTIAREAAAARAALR